MAYRERKFGDRREEPGNYAAKNRIDPRNRTGAGEKGNTGRRTGAEMKSRSGTETGTEKKFRSNM